MDSLHVSPLACVHCFAVFRGGVTSVGNPLFGFDLHEYDELFEGKLDLLKRLTEARRVTWSGRFRAPLENAGVYPRPVQNRLPIWVAVGGTPASADRAGRHGLSLYLAILGQPRRFVELAARYRTASAGHHDLRVGVTSHVHVAPTSQGASDTFHPYYSRYIGQNMPAARGNPLARDAFESWAAPEGALLVGSPAEIVDTILFEHDLLGHDRFLAQVGLGGLPFADTAEAIELLATEVLPEVERALRTPPARSSALSSTR